MECKECKSKPICAGAMITYYICPHCLKQKSSASTYHPRLCPDCSRITNRCSRCCKEI